MARQRDSAGPTTRLFLVDDEPVVRRGLWMLFSLQPDLEVCGEAGTEHEALKGILVLRPDLAVVDLSLKEGDGLALIKQLRQRCPALKILVFSMHEQVHFATAAFAAGAQGYVLKEEGAERALEAVHILLDGGYYLSEAIAAKAPGLVPRTGPRSRKPSS
jgi:DNA-binding NarL/FixJ family response regulator